MYTTIINSSLIQLSSMQTLIGQCNGAKKYQLARIYLHRQYVITSVGCLFALVPLLFCKQFLLALGQEQVVVEYATEYIYAVIPGCLLSGFAMQKSIYCMNLESTKVTIVVALVSNILGLGLLIILVGFLDWGFSGVAMATNCWFMTRMLAVSIYMRLTSNTKITDHNNEPLFVDTTFENLGF